MRRRTSIRKCEKIYKAVSPMKEKTMLLKRVIGFCLLILHTSCAASKHQVVKDRPLVAVMPFVYKATLPEYAGVESGLGDALISELVKSRQFRLIERERIETLLREIQLQQSGLTDSAKEIQVGTQLGAQALVSGSVTSVSVRDEWRSVKFAEKTTRFADIEAEVRMTDIETGEILASGRAVGKSSSAEKHAFGGKIGELASKDSVVHKTVQELAQKLGRELVKTYSRK